MTDALARPTGRGPEPLYDVTVATPSHAERARTLADRLSIGTLGTVALEPAGYPYGSFVTLALDGADPVFLLSELAEHTRNLRRDERASLMVYEGGAVDPLASSRATLLGRCRPVEGDPAPARDAYLGRHPGAAYYLDFKDFHFWRLAVESVRYIGGYGRMSWVSEADWRQAEPDPLAAAADGICRHMNEDHAGALVAYCRAFSRATTAEKVTMTGIDRYGFEMSVETAEGPRPVRLAFAAPIATSEEARAALVLLVKDARARLAP
jgi:putative heme iron utilization protein